MQISLSGPKPRYQAIKDYILSQIETGAWPPNYQIPSEWEMVGQFNISRMTVNRAIRELSNAGILRRVPRVGTFVARRPAKVTLLDIRSIADEVAARGHSYRSNVLVQEEIPAGDDIAAALDIPPNTPVFHVSLVHFEDGRPIQIEDRHVNPEAAPEFLKQDFLKVTPSAYLLAILPLSAMELTIDAKLPSKTERKLLKLPAEQVCLVLKRRSWADHQVVTHVRLTFPASLFNVTARMDLK
jgi:GntR family histidine utilization transcriptional repressor